MLQVISHDVSSFILSGKGTGKGWMHCMMGHVACGMWHVARGGKHTAHLDLLPAGFHEYNSQQYCARPKRSIGGERQKMNIFVILFTRLIIV
jgi:hypothetical protein